MTDKFAQLKYFKKSEFGDGADQLSEQLLLALDKFRELAGVPFTVKSAYRAGDSGYHGRGLAVDIIAPKWSKPPIEFYNLAVSSGLFTGVGIYVNWSTPNALHVDVRSGKLATWLGLGAHKATQSYEAVNATTIKRYKLDVV